MPDLPLLLALALLAWNLFALLLMWHDKRRARRGGQRVPERVLLAVAACGGALGVLGGMHSFRHKTKHPAFTIGVPLLLAAQAAVAVWLTVSAAR